MRIRFTPTAANELEQVLEGIYQVSPVGAKHVSQRIQKKLKYLSAYPNAGIRTNKAGIRRLMATPYPYAIYYELTDGFVTILGVRHAAQNPANMPDAN